MCNRVGSFKKMNKMWIFVCRKKQQITYINKKETVQIIAGM